MYDCSKDSIFEKKSLRSAHAIVNVNNGNSAVIRCSPKETIIAKYNFVSFPKETFSYRRRPNSPRSSLIKKSPNCVSDLRNPSFTKHCKCTQ